MRIVSAFVENAVSMAFDVGSAAWVFDADLWEACGQGTDEGGALRDLRRTLGPRVNVVVAEQLHGPEQAFDRDSHPCTPGERRRTLDILEQTRRETLGLLRSCTPNELDSEAHNRVLLPFVRWPTLWQMGWHIADYECRDTLPAAGLPPKSPVPDLFEELTASAEHVRRHVRQMPANVVVERDGQVWTTVKLLRRLAWHERHQLTLMRTILTRLRGDRSAPPPARAPVPIYRDAAAGPARPRARAFP